VRGCGSQGSHDILITRLAGLSTNMPHNYSDICVRDIDFYSVCLCLCSNISLPSLLNTFIHINVHNDVNMLHNVYMIFVKL